MPDLARSVIDAEIPDGAIWDLKEDGGLDLLYNGMAENHAEVRTFLQSLGYIRNPQKTTILTDLEREFGVENNTGLTEQERRDRVQAIKTEGKNTGSSDDLQAKLIASGFDVQVHINDPPVDPALFVLNKILTVCGNASSVCGSSTAVCGSSYDDLIINGNIYIRNTDLIDMPEGYWHLVNFVGGDATRDGNGAITAIDRVTLPQDRLDEIRRLIVKYKPMYSWVGLIAKFV